MCNTVDINKFEFKRKHVLYNVLRISFNITEQLRINYTGYQFKLLQLRLGRTLNTF